MKDARALTWRVGGGLCPVLWMRWKTKVSCAADAYTLKRTHGSTKWCSEILRYSTVDGSRSSRMGSMTVFLAFFNDNHPNHPWGRRGGVEGFSQRTVGPFTVSWANPMPILLPSPPPTILYYNCNPDETSSRSWTTSLLQTCHMSAMILLHFHTSPIQARFQAEVGHHHRSKHVICLSWFFCTAIVSELPLYPSWDGQV